MLIFFSGVGGGGGGGDVVLQNQPALSARYIHFNIIKFFFTEKQTEINGHSWNPILFWH